VSTEIVVYVLTALAAVVIVLTRLRLGGGAEGARRLDIAHAPVNVHTAAGVLALVAWVTFLLTDGRLSEGSVSLIGIAAVLLWWIVALAGLLILVRWLPSRGKHAAEATEDTWSEGPGLSLLGHLGMVVGVAVFTYAYLFDKV
jgi:hypothetical protein